MLVENLIENKSLRKLSLNGNFIKDEGCEFIAFFLGLPTCFLEEIELQENFISERGGKALFEVLDPSTKLETQ